MSHTLPDTLTVSKLERDYDFGQGIDALDGERTVAQALRPFVFPPDASSTSQSADTGSGGLKMHICRTAQEVRAAAHLDTGARVAANIHPIDISLGGAREIKDGLQTSATSFSLVIECRLLGAKVVLPGSSYILTDAARRCADETPQKFREIYGDYFVAGYSSGSALTAVLTWTSTDKESMHQAITQIRAKVEPTGVPVGLDAGLEQSLDRIAAHHQLELAITLNWVGVSRAHTPEGAFPVTDNLRSISNLLETVRWFFSHHKAELLGYELWHFSRIPDLSRLPKDVPVSSAVFGDLESIKSGLFSCCLAVNGLPTILKGDGDLIAELNERYSLLAGECRNVQKDLIQNAAVRASLMERLAALRRDIEECDTMHSFWLLLQRQRGDEPVGVDSDIGLGASPKTAIRFPGEAPGLWRFGTWSSQSTVHFSKFSSITEAHKTVIKMGGGMRSDDVETTITIEDGEEIVGWKVELKDGKGSWRPQRLPIILTREAVITTRRPPLSGSAEWLFSVYVLRNKYLSAFAPLVSAGSGSNMTTAENPKLLRQA